MIDQIEEIKKVIANANSIVVTSHRSPDGDAIGSAVAMYHYLNAIGKQPVVCLPDPTPDFLNWISEGVTIFNHEDQPSEVSALMSEADLIFCLDYNGASRLGQGMDELLEKASGKKIMIDHHPHPDDFVDFSISVPSVCSTCQLVYEFIEESGNLERINLEIAEAIYLGIVTDTGSFRYPSVDARTHEIASKLIKFGLKHTPVHENTFDNVRIERLKLRGYALAEKLEIIHHYHAAYVYLTEDELKRFHYQKGDTEGLVNVALSVEGVKVAIFMAEKDGQIKMSFRSKGDVAVNKLASEVFDGGGHKNAAGGVSQLSMDETIKKLKAVIPKYFSDINE